MSCVYLAISSGISKMRVQIGEMVVTAIIVPHLEERCCYMSPSLAEHIKSTHAPTRYEDVWSPHVPKHTHGEQRDRSWPKKLSGLASGVLRPEVQIRKRRAKRRKESLP